MSNYEVYLYNLPKVSEDGKECTFAGKSETKSFSEKSAAESFAAEQKEAYERVMLLEVSDASQSLVERYRDGNHELADSIVRR